MRIDFDADAKLNMVTARFTVSHAVKPPGADGLLHSMVFERLRDQVARVLTSDAVRKTEGIYSTDYEVRLYVLTPDQLEKYVQRRAERIGSLPYNITETTA